MLADDDQNRVTLYTVCDNLMT